MKTKIGLLLIVITLLFNSKTFSQTGQARITQVNDGNQIDVSIYLRSSDTIPWSLGFASFVFNYNHLAMSAPSEQSEGRWDNDSNSQYADQILASYGGGSAESIEIGLNTVPAGGSVVPSVLTLVGTVRFNILDTSATHNIAWNQVFSAVLDNHGNDVTGGILFTNPENTPLPVELSSFVSSTNKNNVTLKWSTTQETNNSGFTIERNDHDKNVNGVQVWNAIGFVNGNGNTNEVKSYSFNDRNLNSGKFYYRLKQLDFNGNYEYYNLSNEVNIGAPAQFELSQNFPNPFNPVTKITYDIPIDGKVSLKVFDISGKEVAVLVNDFKTAGYYTINFNGSSFSSGVYFYTLRLNDFTSTKKMLILK